MRCDLKRLTIVGLCTAVCACATPYQSIAHSYTGGFLDGLRVGKLEKISFYGNGYIDATTVGTYTLYRCAEVAKSKGKPYFLLYENLYRASLAWPSESPTIGVVGSKPAGIAFVLFLDHPAPGAKETQKVLMELGPAINKAPAEVKS